MSDKEIKPGVNRREFLFKSAALVGATVAVSSLHALPQSIVEKDKRKVPFDVFDCHLHCPSEKGEEWQWYKVTRNFDEFEQYLDRTGVQKGIINSQRSYGAKPEDFIAGNRETARFAEKSGNRFIGACIVNPLYIEESLREIEFCHDQLGFVWVGELCNYMVPYLYTIPEFKMLVEHTVKLNMVLALHTEHGEMEYIAQNFPQATIAFAHFGDDHEYQDIFKRIDMVAKNPNFYLDTSGYGHDRVGVLEYAVKTIGTDRILFGSDFSINDPGTVIARINNAFITEEQKQKIFAANLQVLLNKVAV